MRCRGEHLASNKACIMCEYLLNNIYQECITIATERKREHERKMAILANCPHFKVDHCRDRHAYRACTKTQRDKWGEYDGCSVSETCAMVCKGDDITRYRCMACETKVEVGR